MICPLNYSARQHNKATQKQYMYALDNSLQKLNFDIELAIIKICEKEIMSVKEVEKFK